MNPIAAYEFVDMAWISRLRGNNLQQSDQNLLWLNPAVNIGNDPDPAEGPWARAEGVAISSFNLHNRSGAASFLGIGVRIPNHYWGAGQWVDSTTTYTDDTTDAQDPGGTDFALETTTNNDGFLVWSRVPFNCISIDVGTASVDAVSVARAVRYVGQDGDAWVAVANMVLQDASATNYATGENLIVWAAPWQDWGRYDDDGGLATATAGLLDHKYVVNVRATDAPGTTAGVADNMSIYRLYYVTEGVADNGTLEENIAPGEIFNPYGDAVVAFFSTANNQNRVSALIRQRS